MKLISLICPHCGAKLTIDMEGRQAFCQYCGNTLLVDDENTININNRVIDEARLKEAEVRLKELEYQHEREIRQETIRKEQKRSFWISVVVFLVFLLITLSVERLRPLAVIVIIAGCVLLSSRKNRREGKCFYRQAIPVFTKEQSSRITVMFFLWCIWRTSFLCWKDWNRNSLSLNGGCFGIGWLIDMVTIACGVFRDSQGNYLKDW